MNGRDWVYALRDVSKSRGGDGGSFQLVVPSLTIKAGDLLVLKGSSGCGKSTVLDLLATTLEPESADRFDFAPDGNKPADVATLWRRRRIDDLTLLRCHHIGYVLQTGGLISYLTVRENILLPARLNGTDARERMEEIAERLDIARLLKKLPGRLSVGERQRVAIARALAHRPAVVLADEPTASVDPLNADRIFALFLEIVQKLGVTAVIATHDWDRLAAAGLTVINHRLERDGNTTRSFFWN